MLYNKDRLIALMDKFDLSGVVAATPENIYYLSGHASWSQNGYRRRESAKPVSASGSRGWTT
jgi:hypothetical protein